MATYYYWPLHLSSDCRDSVRISPGTQNGRRGCHLLVGNGAMGHTVAGLAAAGGFGPERTTAPDRSRGLRVSVGFWCHGPSPPSPSQLERSRSVIGIPTLSRVGGIECVRGRVTVEAVRARCVVTVPATSEVPQCGNSVTALGTGLKIFHVHLPLW